MGYFSEASREIEKKKRYMIDTYRALIILYIVCYRATEGNGKILAHSFSITSRAWRREKKLREME